MSPGEKYFLFALLGAGLSALWSIGSTLKQIRDDQRKAIKQLEEIQFNQRNPP